MASLIKKICFIDAIHEVASLWNRLNTSSGLGEHMIVAHRLEVQAHLKSMKIPCLPTTAFVGRPSHEQLLKKAERINTWMYSTINVVDSNGVSRTYQNSAIFYARWYYLYILWAIETIENVRLKLDNQTIVKSDGVESADLYPLSLYGVFGQVCDKFMAKGIEVETFKVNPPKPGFEETLLQYAKKFIGNVSHTCNLMRLTKLAKKRKTALFLSSKYNMANIENRLKERLPDVLPLYLLTTDRQEFLESLSLRQKRYIQLPLSGFFQQGQFKATLAGLQAVIEEEINRESDIFTSRGIYWGDIFKNFLRNKLMPHLLQLNSNVSRLNKVLQKIKPGIVIAQSSVDQGCALGELSRQQAVPSILVSHGTMVPPKNEYETIEWKDQGALLMNTEYQYNAIQSPWAEKYLQAIPAKSKGVKTGPLLFATCDKSVQTSLREAIIPGFKNKLIILHASTPNIRPFVYETHDEYIRNINYLIDAVSAHPEVHLIIRFRPDKGLAAEGFKNLLNESDCYSIHTDRAFSDFLTITDLLVSYSSTAIEEALNNFIPVLMFDPDGKYCHIPGARRFSKGDPESGACYFAGSVAELEKALPWLIENHMGQSLPESLWEEHVFPENETVPIEEFCKPFLS